MWLCVYNFRLKLLQSFRLLKFDVKPEKIDCEKTELSGITDRSHKATVTSRSVTSLAHEEGWRIFRGKHKFYVESMYENNGYACNISKTFFQGRRKFSPGWWSPPLKYKPVHHMQTSHCRLDWCMSNGYVFRKTSDSFSFGYLDIFSSWLG